MRRIAFYMVLLHVLFAGLLLHGGCAMKRSAMWPLATIEGVKGHFMEGQIVDMKAGETVSFDDLMGALASVRVVFVGEVHNNPEHHLVQVQILQGLLERDHRLTVAMEFFEAPQQETIDAYMAGHMTESAFLDAVNWRKSWSFPYHFYRPLILLAKSNERPLLALNAPHDIVRKVARSGIESLEPGERTQVAEEIDLENDAHRSYLLEVYQAHPHKKMKDFQTFYEAQCVWEETMADGIARYLSENDGKMVVFSGNGHILNRFGIPERVMRRIDATMATVLLYPLTDASRMNKKMADYVWLTSECSAGVPMMHTRPRHSAE